MGENGDGRVLYKRNRFTEYEGKDNAKKTEGAGRSQGQAAVVG